MIVIGKGHKRKNLVLPSNPSSCGNQTPIASSGANSPASLASLNNQLSPKNLIQPLQLSALSSGLDKDAVSVPQVN